MQQPFDNELRRRALVDQLGADTDPLAVPPMARPGGAAPAPGTSAAPTPQPSFGVPGSTADFVTGLSRRGGGSGGSALGGAGRGAGIGSTVGSVLPGVGTAVGAGVGALIGGIHGAFTNRAETAQTDFGANDARSAVGRAYQEFLGREASPQEIQTHLQNVGWQGGDRFVGEQGLGGIFNAIRNSPEAAAFAAGGGRTPEPAATASATDPQAGGGAPQDTSQWDTDGYSAPQHTASATGSAPPGWDATKWADPNHQTPKYVVGRIMTAHPNTEEGRAAMIADIEKAYPGSSFNGKDKVTIPGVGTIDIFGAAGAGEFRPQWIDTAAEGDGGGSAQTAASGQAAFGGVPLDALMSGDPIARIQAAIAQYSGQRPNFEALLGQLER